MKKALIPVVIFLVGASLLGCGSNSNSEGVVEETTEIFTEEIGGSNNMDLDNSVSSEESEDEMFDEYKDYYSLQDIPEKWVMLTKQDSEFVIFNPCWAGNEQVEVRFFPDDGGSPQIYWFMGQDALVFHLISAKWEDKVLKVECTEDKSILFRWKDEEQRLGEWSFADYSNSVLFVASEAADNYRVVNEECDDEF